MSINKQNTFHMWHGSRRWDGVPELRAAKAGRAEWGAGIYGTTNFLTGQKYAAGGGKVQLLTIEAGGVLEETAIPLSVAKAFALKNFPRRVVADCVERMEEICGRVADKIDLHYTKISGYEAEKDWIPAQILRNHCVNYGFSSGKKGLAMSQFLADLGITCSIDRGGMGNEYWIAIYDPKIIVEHKPYSFKKAVAIGLELESPYDQLAAKKKGVELNSPSL